MAQHKLDGRTEPSRRVLVVDDEQTIRELVAEALGEAGFQVLPAGNGARALEIMHDWVPDLIVLDLMMPRLDGLSFVELMRLNPQLASIPVVLVTAAYAAGAAAQQLGARACITKPFELDDLLNVVREIIGEPLAAQVDQAAIAPTLAHEL